MCVCVCVWNVGMWSIYENPKLDNKPFCILLVFYSLVHVGSWGEFQTSFCVCSGIDKNKKNRSNFSGDHSSGNHFSGDHFSGDHFSGDHFSGDFFSRGPFFQGPFFQGTIFPRIFFREPFFGDHFSEDLFSVYHLPNYLTPYAYLGSEKFCDFQEFFGRSNKYLLKCMKHYQQFHILRYIHTFFNEKIIKNWGNMARHQERPSFYIICGDQDIFETAHLKSNWKNLVLIYCVTEGPRFVFLRGRLKEGFNKICIKKNNNNSTCILVYIIILTFNGHREVLHLSRSLTVNSCK